MITFDKLKIVTQLNYVNSVCKDQFVINTKKGKVMFYKYEQNKPFYLLLLLNYERRELTIEFSGKILMDNYYQLININNIEDCLLRINELGICKIDVHSILQDSEIVKCDVTRDCELGNIPFQNLIQHIKQNLSNYSKWVAKEFKNEGVIIENIVKTKRYHKRLVIYDKERELQLTSNQDFLNSLLSKETLLSYFNNKVRFELNLNSKSSLRKLLNINNNNIQSVLSSTANPIFAVINEVLNSNHNSIVTDSVRNYEHILFLKECNYNLMLVEAKIRLLSSNKTSIRRAMIPYQRLCSQKDKFVTEVDVRQMLS